MSLNYKCFDVHIIKVSLLISFELTLTLNKVCMNLFMSFKNFNKDTLACLIKLMRSSKTH